MFDSAKDAQETAETGEGEQEETAESGDTGDTGDSGDSGDTGGGRTPCEVAGDRIEARYEECGVHIPDHTGSEEIPCDEEDAAQALCTAACVEAAACGVLDGTNTDYTSDAWVAYTECVTACV
jgi:hypothetical protein